MWDRKEIKAFGKLRFKANYWRSVLSAFLISILASGSAAVSRFNSGDDETETDPSETFNDATQAFDSMSEDEKTAIAMIVAGAILASIVFGIIWLLIKIFIQNPLQVGCYGFFRENAGGYQADLGVLKSGFGNYGHTFITLLLKDIFLFLWTCLFIVPGFIKMYSYRMVPFILRDNPQMSAREVITASRRLMDGQKWNVFVFDLSYIGWYLLGLITCGLVNVFWTDPYRQNANAALYLRLIGEDEPVQKLNEPVAIPQ